MFSSPPLAECRVFTTAFFPVNHYKACRDVDTGAPVVDDAVTICTPSPQFAVPPRDWAKVQKICRTVAFRDLEMSDSQLSSHLKREISGARMNETHYVTIL
ncbi:hypothetical protein GCG54_00004470 [Colletotrichum gloeosporioides]|uniref:Uncharacterized protein n=1 Tax=Colletotrichum gloeosporioides TaxID=474922 RepID=A0A8H4CLS9_COLGL|nr:uncharacterized protein GCG54_00004470 [Colletotrichum gloeosporioides]KAF3806144.1 hypothetical protein GCG54_00004470 [Colletotrichum gloeosporioides]